MSIFLNFVPMLVFVGLLAGSGVYHMLMHVDNAFYKLPAAVAILPAVAIAWLMRRGSVNEKIDALLDGMRHKDIMTMCFIFLLVGAFSSITESMGCNEATVQFCLQFISPRFVIIGLFLIAAIVSTSIGTSMGAVAAIVPIAVSMCLHLGISVPFGVGTVVGGAMLGDNLSLISDTTIAAVSSQGADLREKFWLNLKLSSMAGLITLTLLIVPTSHLKDLPLAAFDPWLIVPYLSLLVLALSGLHAFLSLSLSILIAGVIAFAVVPDYGLTSYVQAISSGYTSMHEILILSLFVGGMSGLIGSDIVDQFAVKLTQWMARKRSGRREAELMILGLSAMFDVLLANNTIAILMVGPMAKRISVRHKIAPHVCAAWMDTASCVFQGIIPYGAQILLASTLAGLSPFEILPYVYYCYILMFVLVFYILFNRSSHK